MSRTSTKEKIIKLTMKEIDKRLKHINFILDGRFLSEILENQKQAIEHCQKNLDDHEGNMKVLNKAKRKENKLRKYAKEQSENMIAYIDEKVKLEMEKSDLVNELFVIDMRKKRS